MRVSALLAVSHLQLLHQCVGKQSIVQIAKGRISGALVRMVNPSLHYILRDPKQKELCQRVIAPVPGEHTKIVKKFVAYQGQSNIKIAKGADIQHFYLKKDVLWIDIAFKQVAPVRLVIGEQEQWFACMASRTMSTVIMGKISCRRSFSPTL